MLIRRTTIAMANSTVFFLLPFEVRQFRLGRYRKATATPNANTVELAMAANATPSVKVRYAAGADTDNDTVDAHDDRKR